MTSVNSQIHALPTVILRMKHRKVSLRVQSRGVRGCAVIRSAWCSIGMDVSAQRAIAMTKTRALMTSVSTRSTASSAVTPRYYQT